MVKGGGGGGNAQLIKDLILQSLLHLVGMAVAVVE